MKNKTKNTLSKDKIIDLKAAYEMYAEILNCADIKEYLDKSNKCFVEVNLPKRLKKMMNEKGFCTTELIQKTNIEKSYFYQILNGRRTPSRDKLLRIAFVMELNLSETQKLLLAADKSILYPRRRRDAALISCIHKHLSLHDTQVFLFDMGIEILV